MIRTVDRNVLRRIVAFAGLTLSAFVSRAEEPDMLSAEEADVPPLPLWQPSATVTTGAGYKDNLLLSNIERENSAFLKTGLELFLFRLPVDGPQFHASVTGDDIRFLSGDSVEKEQTLFSNAQLSQEFLGNWQASIGLDYVYVDQVLDVSTLETNLTALQVRAHELQANPGIRRDLGSAGIIELHFPVSRELYSGPLDDAWEWGPRLTFIRPYGNESEWAVTFSYDHRDYDERNETDEDGFDIPGTQLSLHQHRVDLAWKHHIDEARHWRLTTKLSYKVNQDSGSGYFDYLRFQVLEQLRFRAEKWELTAEARAAYYDYVKQPVSETDSSTRERAEFGFNFRIQRELARWVTLFAEYEYEHVESNQDIEGYSVNVVSAGAMWEF